MMTDMQLNYNGEKKVREKKYSAMKILFGVHCKV